MHVRSNETHSQALQHLIPPLTVFLMIIAMTGKVAKD